MIYSSSSFSLSIWLNSAGHSWTISQEMPSFVGTAYGRSLLAISRAPMCALVTPRT
jgi:hypothetical protein